MHFVGAEYVAADRAHQGLEQRTRPTDPVGQGRAIKVDPFAGVDLALPVQGKVIAVLGNQDVCEEPRACEPALNRTTRRQGLHDPLAACARELRAHVLYYFEVARHVLEHLGDVLAEWAELASTIRACAGVLVHDLLARKLGRQGPTSGLLGRLLRRRSHLEGLGGKACLEILDGELHLHKLPIELLGGAAVLHALQVRDLEAQLLELKFLGN